MKASRVTCNRTTGRVRGQKSFYCKMKRNNSSENVLCCYSYDTVLGYSSRQISGHSSWQSEVPTLENVQALPSSRSITLAGHSLLLTVEYSKTVNSQLNEANLHSPVSFTAEIGRPTFNLTVHEDKKTITLHVTDPLTAVFKDGHQLSIRDIFSDELQYKVLYRKQKSTGTVSDANHLRKDPPLVVLKDHMNNTLLSQATF